MKKTFTPSQAHLAITALLNTGDLAAAEKFIQRADPAGQPDLYCAIAAVHLANSRPEQALQLYQQALDLQPGHNTAGQGKARILAAQGVRLVEEKKTAQANKLLEEALKEQPGDMDLNNFKISLEMAAIAAGSSTSASENVIAALEELFNKDFRRASIAHQLAILYHRRAIELEQQGAFDELAWQKALGFWAAALASGTYWQEWFQSRKTIYPVDESALAEMLATLRFDKVKTNVRAVNQEFAKTYSASGQAELANRHRMLVADWSVELTTAVALQKTIDLLHQKKETPPLTFACGPLLWKIFGLEEQAQKTAEQALQLQKGFGPAEQALESQTPVAKARALKEQGLIAEAIQMLRAYVAIAPKGSSAKSVLAELLMSDAENLKNSDPLTAFTRWDEAKKLGGNATAIDEALVTCALSHMEKYLEAKQVEKAKDILQRAIQLVPHARPLRDNYANIAHKQILDKFEKAIGKSPSRDKLLSAARIARQEYEALDRIVGPNHPRVKEQLSQLEGLINKAEASELNQQAVALIDQAVSAAKYGNRYSARSNLESAQEKLRRAKSLDPSDDVIQQNLNTVNNILVQIRGY